MSIEKISLKIHQNSKETRTREDHLSYQKYRTNKDLSSEELSLSSLDISSNCLNSFQYSSISLNDMFEWSPRFSITTTRCSKCTLYLIYQLALHGLEYNRCNVLSTLRFRAIPAFFASYTEPPYALVHLASLVPKRCWLQG